MATIKTKQLKAKPLKAAEIIPAFIVPFRKKNRPPQLATQLFQGSTFFVNLYPNVHCSISEVQDFCRYLSKLFRNIITNNCRYQQKLHNLPSFVGIRNICCRFDAAYNRTNEFIIADLPDVLIYPYLRLRMSDLQAAAFIVRQFCKLTGQMPHNYNIISKKAGRVHHIEDYNDKSNPFLIEHLAKLHDALHIHFGAVAHIDFESNDDYIDLYNVPGIRVSNKFGCQLTIYAERYIEERRRLQESGELVRARKERDKHSQAVERLLARQRRQKQILSNMSLSNYGAYKYRATIGNRYEAARDRTNRFFDTRHEATKKDDIIFTKRNIEKYDKKFGLALDFDDE